MNKKDSLRDKIRLIDADDLKSFFCSEFSGTDEIIEDLMQKHNLDYLHDVDELCVKQFAWDLLNGVENVINTQKTIATSKSNNICDYCSRVKGTSDCCGCNLYGGNNFTGVSVTEVE